MINLIITEQDAQVIQVALLELKLKESFSTFSSIKEQLENYYKSKEQKVNE